MKYIKSFEKNIDEAFVTSLAKKYSLDYNVCELLIARGYDSEVKLGDYLDPSKTEFHNPFLFEDMTKVVELIREHISKHSKILVFGDYDADGISATAIMIKALNELNADTQHFLPNRYDDGYGLTMETAERVCSTFAPNLIITVDCGIASVDEVDYIKGRGIDIIVTDHHEPAEKLPNCFILNPKATAYPYKALCGAGVALKVVEALGLDIKDYLPLCMIATIADIVELVGENRKIVTMGLSNYKLLPKGILAMLEKNDIKDRQPLASEIAFRLVPKLNASGRMGDAEMSLKLYLEQDSAEINKIIKHITDYNISRQALCNKVYDDVKEKLSSKNIFEIKSIIASSNEWNVGILGIVAARISEEFNRPTFLFSQVGDQLIGSARSVNGVNIHTLLSEMSELLDKFGGHTMAAGVTINVKNFDAFCLRCEEYIKNNFAFDDLVPTRKYDIEMDTNNINDKLMQSILAMEPCGHGNQTPIIKIKIQDGLVAPMKNHLEHLTIKYKNFSLLAFNSINYYFALKENKSTNILTEINQETFRGKKSISGIIKSIDYSDVYRPANEDVIYAEYLRQLTYKDSGKVQYDTYNRNELIRCIIDMKASAHGTLIVANDYNTYINFKTIFDSSNVVQNRVFELLDQSGLNTILLSPRNFNYFNTFNKIIFLDPILDNNYIAAIRKSTMAKIMLPHKVVGNYTIFSKIKLGRDVFGKYYRIFEYCADSGFTVINEYELYNKVLDNYKAEKDINYLQFMACYYVFVDLSIIIPQNNNGLSIKIDKSKKTTLELSAIYNKYKTFQIGY